MVTGVQQYRHTIIMKIELIIIYVHCLNITSTQIPIKLVCIKKCMLLIMMHNVYFLKLKKKTNITRTVINAPPPPTHTHTHTSPLQNKLPFVFLLVLTDEKLNQAES